MPDQEDTKEIKILLVESNADDVETIKNMLIESMGEHFKLDVSTQLEKGLGHLTEDKIDVVLLDLSLSESHGVDTFCSVYTRAPNVPIVVITSYDDELSAIKAARMGAEDYLIKGKIDSSLLAHSIRFAIERKRIMKELEHIRRAEQETLHAMSIIDELTGLYNRRGFIILFNQQKKVARRSMKGMILLFINVDNMKKLNDVLGRDGGDKILSNIAEVIRTTFRDTDISARIEGDKFVVLAIDTQKDNTDKLIARLQERIKSYDLKSNKRHRLSVSIGSAFYDPDNPVTIDTFLITAEKSIYMIKERPSVTPS